MVKKILLLLSCLALLALVCGGFLYAKSLYFQAKLQPFYTPPPVPEKSSPGDLLREEVFETSALTYGTAHRVLYVTNLSDGKKVAASGTIFVPEGPAPKQGRKIVAWAHGTVGMVDSCAPSRQETPGANITWLNDTMKKGWIVAATDYYGLGTPGTERFLIGQDQSRDVLNSVRAAQKIQRSGAGNEFVLFGLSQGGQTVLATAHVAGSYAPELKLLGVVAAGPAAQLTELIEEQYKKAIGWVIGPEIAKAWPIIYPSLDLKGALSKAGETNYERIAGNCIAEGTVEAVIRNFFRQQFFDVNPLSISSWKKALTDQTQNPLSKNIPLLVVQSLSDVVVLPDTTALYVKRSCEASSNISTLWLKDVAHQNTANVAGPQIVSWITDRFDGEIASNSCKTPLPINPAKSL